MTLPSLIIASDHAGYALKSAIIERFSAQYAVVDLGAHDATTSVDYPDQAYKLVEFMVNSASVGVLVCGSGIGMSIAANRYRNIRAALCHNVETAVLARQHNDANVLCLGERVIGLELGLACTEAFLSTNFEGARHLARVKKLS